MIDAINGSGLGLTASFTTAGAAGDAAPTNNSSDTGIMITGNVAEPRRRRPLARSRLPRTERPR